MQEQDSTCLSREQLDDIDLLFADEIVKNAKINFKDVRNGRSESLNLSTFTDQQELTAMVKKAYRRIKYLQTLSAPKAFFFFSIQQKDPQEASLQWIEQHYSPGAPSLYMVFTEDLKQGSHCVHISAGSLGKRFRR